MPTPIALTYNGYVAQIANMGVFQTSLVAGVVTPIDASMQNAVPQALNYAELRIQRDLDMMQLFSANSYNTTPSNAILPIPLVDFVTITTAQVNGSPLQAVSNEYIQNVYTTQTGTPAYFAVQGGDNATFGNTYTNLLLAPTPDQAYSIYIRGTTRIPSLYTYANTAQAGTNTTFISTWLPDLLIQASMIFIAEFQRNFGAGDNDPGMMGGYEGQYQALLRGAQSEDARRRFAASGWTSYSAPTNATPGR